MAVAKRTLTPKKKAAKPPTAHQIAMQKQGDLLAILAKSELARDTVKAMLRFDTSKDHWRGLCATPPGSLLETVLTAWTKGTDIPLEIPFFAVLHFLSAHLLRDGITIDFAGQTVKPDLWSVVLASSGSGKTWTTSRLKEATGVENEFPEPSSAAAFAEILRDNNNSLWIRDEFAQFLKALDQQPHMVEMKGLLLSTYDGERIERTTKTESVIVDDPALVIFGLTVLETCAKNVSTESMLDGFAQRFGYVIAQEDASRPMRSFPIYRLRAYKEKIRHDWEQVIAGIKHTQYVVAAAGEAGFCQSFDLLLPAREEIPRSFFRRILFRGVRYALLYHLLLGKEGSEIDAEDMGWAGRICGLHIQDAKKLVGNHGLGELEVQCRRAEEVRAACLAEGVPFTARELGRRVNSIKSAAQAKQIMELIAE